jgi:hypothetical protein
MSELFRNPQHWRDRAEETRAKADRCSKDQKERLLKIAAEYDQLAERAEEWRTVSEAEQQDVSPARTKEGTS